MRLELASPKEDIREELITIALRGFPPLVLMGAVCLVAGTALMAGYYNDRLLLRMTFACLVVGGLRYWLAVVLSRQPERVTGPFGSAWSATFGTLTVLICLCVATITMYNFRFHDLAGQVLCILGTFTMSSGISSRIGLQPRVSQFSVILLQGSLGLCLLFSNQPLVRPAMVLCLVTTFTYCVSIRNQHQVIEDQIRTRRRLRQLAHHDSLTGLENRHQFETKLQEACSRGLPFSLLMIDLDDFKQVNDLHGHAIGDEVLKQVARRLENLVRTTDLLARLGGDEFVILLTDMPTVDSAHKLAKRIQKEIALPFEKNGHKISIGTSIGIKLVGAGDSHPESALIEADRALYRVKAGGQGGFEFV
jgi:diguanylate cyclase (GGDEF)-like protein